MKPRRLNAYFTGAGLASLNMAAVNCAIGFASLFASRN